MFELNRFSPNHFRRQNASAFEFGYSISLATHAYHSTFRMNSKNSIWSSTSTRSVYGSKSIKTWYRHRAQSSAWPSICLLISFRPLNICEIEWTHSITEFGNRTGDVCCRINKKHWMDAVYSANENKQRFTWIKTPFQNNENITGRSPLKRCIKEKTFNWRMWNAFVFISSHIRMLSTSCVSEAQQTKTRIILCLSFARACSLCSGCR